MMVSALEVDEDDGRKSFEISRLTIFNGSNCLNCGVSVAWAEIFSVAAATAAEELLSPESSSNDSSNVIVFIIVRVRLASSIRRVWSSSRREEINGSILRLKRRLPLTRFPVSATFVFIIAFEPFVQLEIPETFRWETNERVGSLLDVHCVQHPRHYHHGCSIVFWPILFPLHRWPTRCWRHSSERCSPCRFYVRLVEASCLEKQQNGTFND